MIPMKSKYGLALDGHLWHRNVQNRYVWNPHFGYIISSTLRRNIFWERGFGRHWGEACVRLPLGIRLIHCKLDASLPNSCCLKKNVEEKHGELSQRLCKVTEEKAANYEKNTKMWLDSDVDQTPWISWKKTFSKTTSPQGYLATWREYFARQIWCMSCTVALILRVWVSIRSKANHEDFIQLRQCLEYTWKNGGSFCMSSMCCLSLVFHVLFVAPFARAQNLKKLQDEKHLPAGRVGIFQFNSWCFFVLPRVIQDGKLFYDHGEGMYLHEGLTWRDLILATFAWKRRPNHDPYGQACLI